MQVAVQLIPMNCNAMYNITEAGHSKN